MAAPLINPEPTLEQRQALQNHHNMIKLRRISDQIVYLKAQNPNLEHQLKIQKLKLERDAIRGTMAPLRLAYNALVQPIKVNT